MEAKSLGPPKECLVTRLAVANPVLISRNNHPLQSKKYGWDDLFEFPLLEVLAPDIEGANFFSEYPEFVERLAKVKPLLQISHVFTALQIIRSTDFIMASAPIFTQEGDLYEGLKILPMPSGKKYDLRYVIVEHQRTQGSPAHQYLRQQFMSVVQGLRAGDGAAS